LSIAAGVAGVAAGGGDVDETGEVGGGGIEVDEALGDVEGAVRDFVGAGEGEGYGARVGIDVEGLVLGEGEGGAEEWQCGKEGA
jgi:hypothetical protein